MLSSFVLILFADVYAILSGEMTTQDYRFALPNLSFVAFYALWIVFNYEKEGVGAKVGDLSQSGNSKQRPHRPKRREPEDDYVDNGDD